MMKAQMWDHLPGAAWGKGIHLEYFPAGHTFAVSPVPWIDTAQGAREAALNQGGFSQGRC